MATVQIGDTVLVHYTGKLADGTVFDTSAGGEPIQFTTGKGMIIPGFEAGVIGMTPGEVKTVNIPADEAFGCYHEDRVLKICRDKFPEDFVPQIGQSLQIGNDGDQAMVVTVTAIDEQGVTLDANHPLAGKDLIFDIELVSII